MPLISPEKPRYQLIQSDAELAAWLPRWQQQDCIALDTEFVRTDTYYPKPGLVQLASDDGLFLIDPLTLERPRALVPLLQSPKVIKLVHACSEDLELFKSWLQLVPEPLFDTQIAAAFLGYGVQLGYKNLVERQLGIELPKGEQRSDWTRRPLSEDQLEYAALDVHYLAGIYQALRPQLDSSGKLPWVVEECQRLAEKVRQGKDDVSLYLDVKGAANLDAADLNVLQALTLWREACAREKNLPRGFVLRDPVLLELARLKPSDLTGLGRINDLSSKAVRKYGTAIIDAVASGRADTRVLQRPLGPLPKSMKPFTQRLRAWVTEQSQRLDLPQELLLNRKIQTALLDARFGSGLEPIFAQLSPWKLEAIGDELRSLLMSMQLPDTNNED